MDVRYGEKNVEVDIMKNVKVNCADLALRKKIIAAVLDNKLDRRKTYCVGMFGELAIMEAVTTACSGCLCDCGDGYPCGHGCSGCDWCGYTGKTKQFFPDPVKVGDGYFQLKPAKCDGCGKPIAHFDAGCPECAAKCAGGWV